jgi:nucleotide-binding universal stress UspA family protein
MPLVAATGDIRLKSVLIATDFSKASEKARALPYAISSANHFGTQLGLLHVLPAVPMPEGLNWPTADDVIELREKARMAALRRLQELTSQNLKLVVEPDCFVEFGLPSEGILQVADTLKADAIILGLHRSSHIDTKPHMPWATAYEVVCGACCSVLTVRN